MKFRLERHGLIDKNFVIACMSSIHCSEASLTAHASHREGTNRRKTATLSFRKRSFFPTCQTRLGRKKHDWTIFLAAAALLVSLLLLIRSESSPTTKATDQADS